MLVLKFVQLLFPLAVEIADLRVAMIIFGFEVDLQFLIVIIPDFLELFFEVCNRILSFDKLLLVRVDLIDHRPEYFLFLGFFLIILFIELALELGDCSLLLLALLSLFVKFFLNLCQLLVDFLCIRRFIIYLLFVLLCLLFVLVPFLYELLASLVIFAPQVSDLLFDLFAVRLLLIELFLEAVDGLVQL